MAAEPHLIPLAPARSKLAELEASLETALRGKREVVRLSLVCLFARGHLLVTVPIYIRWDRLDWEDR